MIVPAYALCNLPPFQAGEFTPADLEFMITIRQEQMKPLQKEPKKPKKIYKPLSDVEMWDYAGEINKQVKKHG